MSKEFTVTANGQPGKGGNFVGVYHGTSLIMALVTAWKARRRGGSIVRIEWRK